VNSADQLQPVANPERPFKEPGNTERPDVRAILHPKLAIEGPV
jgi:hypothetical protein